MLDSIVFHVSMAFWMVVQPWHMVWWWVWSLPPYWTTCRKVVWCQNFSLCYVVRYHELWWAILEAVMFMLEVIIGSSIFTWWDIWVPRFRVVPFP